jgi:hypothetical protein
MCEDEVVIIEDGDIVTVCALDPDIQRPRPGAPLHLDESRPRLERRSLAGEHLLNVDRVRGRGVVQQDDDLKILRGLTLEAK